jgi:hypothetical protein
MKIIIIPHIALALANDQNKALKSHSTLTLRETTTFHELTTDHIPNYKDSFVLWLLYSHYIYDNLNMISVVESFSFISYYNTKAVNEEDRKASISVVEAPLDNTAINELIILLP